MKKLRLLYVTVQPHFVVDDGKDLEPIDHPPINIPGAEWPTYSSDRFQREVKAWEKELLGNRQQRRTPPKSKANKE